MTTNPTHNDTPDKVLVERAMAFDWHRSSYTDLWDWMIEARAALSSRSGEPVIGEDAPAILAGMKPWHGGPKPSDWSGEAVQFRSGEVMQAPVGAVWKLGWDHNYGQGDIIAYTPKPTPTDTADRIGYVNADPTPAEIVAADRREALRRMSDAARDLNVASALDLLATYADDETLASLIAVPDGMVFVPIEPTEAMLTEAVDNVGPIGCCNHTPDTARETWSAMIAARPTGEQEPDRIGFYSAGDGE